MLRRPHATIQRDRLDGGFEEHESFAITGEDDPTAGVRVWHAAVQRGSDEGLYHGLLDGALSVDVVYAAEESAKTGARVAIPAC